MQVWRTLGKSTAKPSTCASFRLVSITGTSPFPSQDNFFYCLWHSTICHAYTLQFPLKILQYQKQLAMHNGVRSGIIMPRQMQEAQMQLLTYMQKGSLHHNHDMQLQQRLTVPIRLLKLFAQHPLSPLNDCLAIKCAAVLILLLGKYKAPTTPCHMDQMPPVEWPGAEQTFQEKRKALRMLNCPFLQNKQLFRDPCI